MLVLARKRNQCIRVGDIRIMVVSVKDGKVKLGIEAPQDVPVHREEVYQAMKAQGADDAVS